MIEVDQSYHQSDGVSMCILWLYIANKFILYSDRKPNKRLANITLTALNYNLHDLHKYVLQDVSFHK